MNLTNHKGEIFSLGAPVGGGGEGTVYLVNGRPDLVAKIYTRSSQDITSKLMTMLSVKPAGTEQIGDHVSICWPQEVLFDLDKSKQLAAGFTMHRFDKKKYLVLASIYLPRTRRTTAHGFTWRYLVNAASNLAGVVHSMHASSWVIGDINDGNFFISDSALVSLIDCDSIRVPRADGGFFHCEVSKPPFLPPELQGKNLPSFRQTEASDNFGLAVLIFQLLMEGNHPFRIKKSDLPRDQDPPELEDLIKAGEYPYDKTSRYSPPRAAPPYELLSLPIRTLFTRTFRDSARDPSLRPSAMDWKAALDGLAQTLAECKQNALHVFPTHLSACPWCQRAKDLGFDSFPKFVPQIPLPPKPFGATPKPISSKPSAAANRPPAPQPGTLPYVQPPATIAAGPPPTSQATAPTVPPVKVSPTKPTRILIVPVVAAIISFLVLFAIAFSRHLYLVQVRFSTYMWLCAAVVGACLNLKRRRYPQCLGNLAQFFGLPWLIERFDFNLLPVMLASAVAIFLCARSLILLFENRFRRISMFSTKRALLLAGTLSSAPILCVVLLLAAQELPFRHITQTNAPIVDGVAPAHLLVCKSLQKLCSCEAANTLEPGQTAYVMLTSSLMPSVNVTVSYAGSAPTGVQFSRGWHRSGQQNCMSAPLTIPNSASGFAAIHASFDVHDKSVDERVPIASIPPSPPEADKTKEPEQPSDADQAHKLESLQSVVQTGENKGLQDIPAAPNLPKIEPEPPPTNVAPVISTNPQREEVRPANTDLEMAATAAVVKSTSEVEKTIEAWAAAIAANDVEKETSLFADTVNVNGYNGSRTALKQAKLQAISQGFKFKTFTIRDLLVTVHGPNNADVSLTRVWQSNKSNGQGRSRMTLSREGGQWRITGMTDR
jgi:ketosteroid isomerase-like protein